VLPVLLLVREDLSRVQREDNVEEGDDSRVTNNIRQVTSFNHTRDNETGTYLDNLTFFAGGPSEDDMIDYLTSPSELLNRRMLSDEKQRSLIQSTLVVEPEDCEVVGKKLLEVTEKLRRMIAAT